MSAGSVLIVRCSIALLWSQRAIQSHAFGAGADKCSIVLANRVVTLRADVCAGDEESHHFEVAILDTERASYGIRHGIGEPF
jgi:hypothetical protein